jgi:hypothetical protein
MANWCEFGVWVVGLLLVYEGLALRLQVRRRGFIRAIPFVGVAIILAGAGLLYWNARGLQRVANSLQVPHLAIKAAERREELEKLPLAQRKDFSVRLAKAEFVSSGELVDVVFAEPRRCRGAQ